MNIDAILSEKFDLEPMEGEVITSKGELILPEHQTEDETVKYDYDVTRKNLYSLLDQGQDALASALQVAKQSEHPRAFEVVSNMIKQLADINLQLLDLTEKKQNLFLNSRREENTTNITTTNNNAIFVGSTQDLLKSLKSL